MTSSLEQSNPIDALAEEFVARYRRGERPALSEYTTRHPDLAEQIEALFPTLLVMEQLRPASDDTIDGPELPAAATGKAPLPRFGDFRVIREIGRGGMGVVYEAEQVSLGRRVALKVLPDHLLRDEKQKKRFQREARAAARLHHTNIVPVFGVGEQDGHQYYVMQYIHGLGLDQVLAELKDLRQSEAAGRSTPPLHEPLVVSAAAVAGSPLRQPAAVAVTEVAQALLSGTFRPAPPDASSNASSDASFGPADTPSESPADTPPAAGLPSHLETGSHRLSDTSAGSGSSGLRVQHGGAASQSGSNAYWHSVARIGQQVASALRYAHGQGVIHRDIKPGNLLLDTQGTVWVTDFGLAKADDQQNLTDTGDVLGTLRYMAPEQFEGRGDARSDLYSLGLTLYEMLALRPAFDAVERAKLVHQLLHDPVPQLRSLDPTIPRDLATIVHKSIDRDPAHRYATAGELADDLRRYLNDEPIQARRLSPAARLRRWCRKNPAVAGLTTAVALLLLTAASVSLTAAVMFQHMATDNSRLADELRVAFRESQNSLAQVKEQEHLAQQNLSLALAEQQRAEGNLTLALKALDAVYLEAIGTEKLLGVPLSTPSDDEPRTHTESPLTPQEKQLLQRGLSFYDEFSRQNARTSFAAQQTAQAHYRVGLLQGALGDTEASQAAYRTAIERFEQLTSEQPENADYWRQLAEAYSGLAVVLPDWEGAKGALQSSRNHLSQAIELRGQDGSLYVQRAKISGSLSDFDNEAQDYEQAIKISPNDVGVVLQSSAYYLEARVPKNQEKTTRNLARKLAERAVDLAPDNPGCHLQVARVLSASGEVLMYRRGRIRLDIVESEKALESVARAIFLNPRLDNAYACRSRIRASVGDYQGAIEDINLALSMNPQQIDYLKNRGMIQFQSERYTEAAKDYEAVIQIRPTDYDAYYRLGCIYLNLDNFPDAVKCIRKSLEIRPSNWYVYKRLAEAQCLNQDFHAGLQSIQAALHAYPDDLSTLWYIPAYVGMPPDPEFRRGLMNLAEGAVERASDKAQALADRGAFYARMGEYEKAEHDFARAVELNPNEPSVWSKWGGLALITGEHVFAVNRFSKEIELTPRSWNAWNSRGHAHFAVKNYAEAVRDFSASLELHPQNPNVLRSRATAYIMLRKFDQAKADIEAARRMGKASHIDSYHCALLSLAANDRNQYRAACRDMLTRFGKNENPAEQDFAFWTAALAPQALDDYRSAIALAQQAVELHPQHADLCRSLGALLFRAGRHDEAVKQLAALVAEQEAKPPGASTSTAYSLFFLAMAQHQVGNEQDARTTLTKAVELTKAELNDQQAPPAWNRKLTLELLQDEASRMVGGEPDAAGESPPDSESTTSAEIPPDARVERALSRAFVATLQDLGKFEAAADAWQGVLATDPSDAGLWIARGRWYAERGQHEKADAVFAKAASLTPDELNKFLEAGWWVAGPFPADLDQICPPDWNPDPSVPIALIDLQQQVPAEPVSWRPVAGRRNGTLRLADALPNDSGSAYALAYVYSPEDRTSLLRVSGGSGIRIWCNGRPAFGCDVSCMPSHQPVRVPVALQRGRNTILLRASLPGPLEFRLADTPADRAIAFAEQGLWQEAAKIALSQQDHGFPNLHFSNR